MTIRTAVPAAGGPRPDRRFRRLAAVLAGLLLVTAAVLAVLNAVSGPRLRRVDVDHRLVTTAIQQRLVLYANQPLAKLSKKQVTVTPAADFSLANSADTITVIFKQRLRYGTKYLVTVNDVAPLFDHGRHGRFTTGFTTASAGFYYLVRGGSFNRTGGPDDVIMAGSLNGGSLMASRRLFSAPRIEDFAVLDSKLAVITSGPDKISRLMLVDVNNGGGETAGQAAVRPLPLPARGIADQLQASADGRTIGFRFSEASNPTLKTYDDTVFTFDTSPGHILLPVSGVNGHNAQALDWRFAPDGISLLVSTYDGNLLLVDKTGRHKPVPLGQFPVIGNFSSDGSSISVSTADGFGIFNIPRRQLTPLGRGGSLSLPDGTTVTPVDLRLANNQAGRLMLLQTSDGHGGASGEYLVFSGEHDTVVVAHYGTPPDLGPFDYGLAPNDQYVTIERFDQAAAANLLIDDYASRTGPLNGTTDIIDAANGKKVIRVKGTELHWDR